MILDELEELKGESLSGLLSIATDKFRIIGISNTHTLTTKPTASTVTLHFKPYTSQEMTDIISKRLEAVTLPEGTKSIIVPTALSFACRKVSSQTGDLRACLALVRNAIETAEKEYIKKVLGNKGEDSVPIIPASMAHVISATKAVTTQAPGTASVVRQLNLQARLVLLSLLLATRRLSASLSLINSPNAAKSPSKAKPAPKIKTTEALSEDSLFSFYTELLAGSDSVFHAVSRSECADLLGLLETQGLVERGATGAGAKGKGKKGDKSAIVSIPPTSREEEIVNGLTVTPEGQIEGPTEREIRSIWNRETLRIKREIEDRELVMKKRKDAFEDALEG
jgi:cell division control protein 6